MKSIVKNRAGKIQIILITVVWLLIVTIPILFGDLTDGINWQHIFQIWKEYSIVFVIFVINHFVLLPYLFFKGKQPAYFLTITVLIICTTIILFLTDINRGGKEKRPFPPPHAEFGQERMSPPHMFGKGDMIPPYANLFIMSILLIGFDTGLVFYTKWMQAEQNKLKIEKENIENKMAFLQHQISPHFFMNTLNNIHSLIDYDSEIAKESVISLSKLMRHILYDSQSERISLKKELEFINNYIELMRLRNSKNVKISLDIPNNIPEKQIPPLLFTSYIENAFKYGISYQTDSYINIVFRFTEKELQFQIINSKSGIYKVEGQGGIGIENSRKRLDLMYGENYTLNINNGINIFEVNINIPI